MKKDKLQLLSPLFLKYQAEFEKKPQSRVFAPLAETYRKLGMTEKAMEILSHGIRFNPSYLMGYLGLAFCYFDLQQFNLAYTTLRPFIETNRDNIRLQKLFSEVCLELGKKEEALETLKYLLFINPQDKTIAELVVKIEKEVDDKYHPQHKPIIIPAIELTGENGLDSKSALFDIDKLKEITSSEKNDFDDWMAVDLGHESKRQTNSTAQNDSELNKYAHWMVKKGDLENDSNPVIETAIKESLRVQKIEYNFGEDQDIPAPIITHTLVDLYCGQGHIEKALEVLEKILLLNPNDQKTIKKIKEIQALAQPLEHYGEAGQSYPAFTKEVTAYKSVDFSSHFVETTQPTDLTSVVQVEDLKDASEEEGRRNLMNLIDLKTGPIKIEEDNSRVAVIRLIEEKLSLFLKKIQKRALDYQSCI